MVARPQARFGTALWAESQGPCNCAPCSRRRTCAGQHFFGTRASCAGKHILQVRNTASCYDPMQILCIKGLIVHQLMKDMSHLPLRLFPKDAKASAVVVAQCSCSLNAAQVMPEQVLVDCSGAQILWFAGRLSG